MAKQTDKQLTSNTQVKAEEVKATASTPKVADTKEVKKPTATQESKEDVKTAPVKNEEPKATEIPKVPKPEETKADATTPKAEDKKADSPTDPKAETTADETPKVATWAIDDISSPSHGKFRLKQKGKVIAKIESEEVLTKMGLPIWDATKYAKRNNYIDHVKFELMNAINDGKFDSATNKFKWAEDAKKFKFEGIIAPAPKETKRSTSSNGVKLESPIDLGETINF